jgi:hypothetical protein
MEQPLTVLVAEDEALIAAVGPLAVDTESVSGGFPRVLVRLYPE